MNMVTLTYASFSSYKSMYWTWGRGNIEILKNCYTLSFVITETRYAAKVQIFSLPITKDNTTVKACCQI